MLIFSQSKKIFLNHEKVNEYARFLAWMPRKLMIFLSDTFTSFSSADGNQPGAECWSELDINPRACFHSRSAWEPANEEIGRKIWNFRNNRPKSRLNTRCSKKMTDGPRFEITMDNSQATRRICFENYLRIESNNRTSFVKGTVFISVTGHFLKYSETSKQDPHP